MVNIENIIRKPNITKYYNTLTDECTPKETV